ncbi:TonB-dependent siderophore receptor [Solimicrobium silvestre]|uniref:TonB-siderophor: TonB-dependent siderophore receptor n=1 Tax=Solimicrobium silvestre TaxID=2099400 RepID=A0A2S9GZH7_9BURK|nr:TonB-dependent siderophore receptor [Solimicrobium silvestre]PRC93134.1 TonB-siderophor: TonB-dependent siderophore receptor [Solimicrobium silvestre]
MPSIANSIHTPAYFLPPHLTLRPIALALTLALSVTAPAIAFAQQINSTDTETKLPEVLVLSNSEQQPTEKTDDYTVSKSNTATKLDLSLRETPQSVSVTTSTKMNDFKLDNINQVLAGTTGVTVEKVETDRTYYTARGFDIINFQYDGVGVPLVFGNQNGDLDTAIYDRVEVVRGANGLMSSTGNPSATVNFVRKRPTYDFQASGDVSYGSWDTRRIDADVSGALNSEKTVAARFVVAQQDGNSYLDRYKPSKSVLYGVIEANLSDNTLLTVGHNYQKNDSEGAMWGALPMYYSNGAPTNYGVNTNTSANWSYWDSEEQRTFAELNHHFSNDWQWKTTLSYNRLSTDGKLFYVYGTPVQSTGLGLYSYPSMYDSENKQTLLDSYGTGKYTLGGRQHDLTFGASWSRSTLDDISHYGQGVGTPLTATGAFDGSYPEPSFNASTAGSTYTDKRQSAYAATRLNLADDWKLLIGANYTDAQSTGIAYGISHQTSASATTPYTGLVYDLNKSVSAYASYTEIFNPQYQTNASGATLAPVTGKSYELGLKSDLIDRKLNASAALFRVEQQNAAEQAGYIGTTAYYRGINANSEGVEMELSGELAKGWQANLGYTAMTIKDQDGNPARTYVPKTLLRMATTYQVPQLEKLKIGASFNWQGKTSYVQSAPTNTTTQQGYGLLNLMMRYDISKQLSVSANINNVTNQKYISSLYWSQAYYGAPINGSISLNWKY